VLLGLLVLAGAGVVPAYAAAPAPKVTIEGFIDNTTVWSQNASVTDIDITRNEDKEWYSRTRARLQVTGEVGATKMVLLMEQDNNWGTQAGGCYGTQNGVVNGAGHFGTRDGCLNTEFLGNVEMVWMFVEFPLVGKGSLLPFVPASGIARVGFQPFDNETYKLGVLAFGNYGGAHIDVDITPGIKLIGTYAQTDESGIGPNFSTQCDQGAPGQFCRGDDFGLFFGLAFSPVKGIDLEPIFNYTYIANTANPANPFAYGPRTGKGGVADTLAFFPQGSTENRYTIGLDGRMKFGAFSIEPTIFYQWGSRDIAPGGSGGATVNQGISAWLVDLRAGWQAGPLSIDALGMYTSGNDANDDLPSGGPDIKYYQPFDTNAVYGVDWGAITAITYEYITQLYYGQTGLCTSCSIGYDKYGRIQAAIRAKYAVTPDFVLRGLVSALWTAQSVDTNSNVGGGLGPATNALGQSLQGGGLYQVSAGSGGDAQYLGTEINLGFEWGFAPNIRLLALYAHLFAGDAYNIAGSVGTTVGTSPRDSEDVDMGSLTLRFTF
jgi:hypothetical protein